LVNVSFAQTTKKKKIDEKPKKKNIYISIESIAQRINSLDEDENVKPKIINPAARWVAIMRLNRDGILGKKDAIDSMYRWTNDMWDYMESLVKAKKVKKYSDKEWVFPVRGYTASAIGGHNGSGYIPQGFEFFDVNSGGHPAHDIFIDDSNQDGIDDHTGKPVEILSMSGGIVVETRTNWTPDMDDIKGGNIVYVYDNYTNGLFYYAHMKEVYVKVGDLVKPGTTLGVMGRTGKNAYPSRSPTHLHIMYVRSFDGDLRPENIYNDLIKDKTIQ
jgi:murein DD-endopeptidase MepM/ murein hydrolase activator NlpD